MAWMFRRRSIICRQITSYPFQPPKHSLASMIFRAVHNETEAARDLLPGSNNESNSSCYYHILHHSPLFSNFGGQSNDYKIDIIDDETWQASTGFADVWKDTRPVTNASGAQLVHRPRQNSPDPDLEEVDDLRMHGNLFYKLDRGSKEFEEYNFDFHRRKSSKRNSDQKQSKPKEAQNSNLLKTPQKNPHPNGEKLRKFSQTAKLDSSFTEKKQRTPTFNQLTAPYHEPFCLDIYISKASVRACIIHRATSKVVAVAHSISKDMKFELGSTKNAAACAAVGNVLAQRALADDIHNVVYTPRNGEQLEGKLQNVLQSIINNGVFVKIKIKQKKIRKTSFTSADYMHS